MILNDLQVLMLVAQLCRGVDSRDCQQQIATCYLRIKDLVRCVAGEPPPLVLGRPLAINPSVRFDAGSTQRRPDHIREGDVRPTPGGCVGDWKDCREGNPTVSRAPSTREGTSLTGQLNDQRKRATWGGQEDEDDK